MCTISAPTGILSSHNVEQHVQQHLHAHTQQTQQNNLPANDKRSTNRL